MGLKRGWRALSDREEVTGEPGIRELDGQWREVGHGGCLGPGDERTIYLEPGTTVQNLETCAPAAWNLEAWMPAGHNQKTRSTLEKLGDKGSSNKEP